MGPMPVRNQHPAQLTVMHMAPAPAAVLPGGEVQARADAAYSNLWLSGGANGRRGRVDGEYLRAAARLRVGLGENLEAGIELPFAHTTGGFLDSFVIDYHDLLGLPDQERDGTPRNQFDIRARSSGQTVWAVEREDFALLDVPVTLTWQVADPREGLGVALRGGVEFPTGNDDRGYGNGEIDASIGALFEYEALGVGWYGHAQHTFAGTPDQSRSVGFSFSDVTSLGIAAELQLDDGLCGLVQLEWETSTLRDLAISVVDREQLMLWLGARIDLGARWSMEVGFGEDLRGLVSPDFSAWLGMVWNGSGAPRTGP
jgi:hypothetical protein